MYGKIAPFDLTTDFDREFFQLLAKLAEKLERLFLAQYN